MINSKDISVVVQGPIDSNETPKALKSVRKFFPAAELIVSTWESSDTTRLDCDVLILNQDPGAALLKEHNGKNMYNNINRQLLSTQNGLKRATCRYAMKLRSDLIFTHTGFLRYFDAFPRRVDQYSLFKHKILVSALFTRFSIPLGSRYNAINIPFHISDWWLFGLCEDLMKYFLETPLVDEPCFTQYFDQDENKGKITPYGSITYKFSPEQYFGYSFFSRNNKDIHMEDAADCSEETIEESRKYFVNNFTALEFKQSGIYLNKYPYSKNEMFLGEQYLGLYNFYRQEIEYKKYCDADYKLSGTNLKVFENESCGYAILRVCKHIAKLTDSNKNLMFKAEQIVIDIPVSTLIFILTYIKEVLLKKVIKETLIKTLPTVLRSKTARKP